MSLRTPSRCAIKGNEIQESEHKSNVEELELDEKGVE